MMAFSKRMTDLITTEVAEIDDVKVSPLNASQAVANKNSVLILNPTDASKKTRAVHQRDGQIA
jgi:hypothetical protein